MKKSILLLMLFSIVGITFGQKTTLDDDIIKVDGVDYAKIEKKKGLSFDFSIKGLDGTDLIFFKFYEFNNPNKVSASNPKGRVTYYEVTFLKQGLKCEVECGGTKKSVAKVVAENKLVKNNTVDSETSNNFILINGNKFSDEKKELSGPKVIIIEK